jgi:aminotransferase
LIVNSPHNPTGSVISEKEQTKIADLAVKNDLIVISDEVYEEFVYDGKKHRSIASLPEMKERTLVVNSFSKTFSMPGWRIGYVAGNKEIIDNMSKLSENIITAPASISQIAALKALEGPSDFLDNIREEYQKRRDLLLKELNEMNGISCKKTSGAFYVFPNIQETGYSSLIFAEKLVKEAKVLTVPGSAFGEAGEGYLRISYAATIEDIREGIRRIRSFVKELS